jgi:hypothetical protein
MPWRCARVEPDLAQLDDDVARARLDRDRLRDALEPLGRHVQLVRPRRHVLGDDGRGAEELTVEEHLGARHVGFDAQRPERRRRGRRRRFGLGGGRSLRRRRAGGGTGAFGRARRGRRGRGRGGTRRGGRGNARGGGRWRRLLRLEQVNRQPEAGRQGDRHAADQRAAMHVAEL